MSIGQRKYAVGYIRVSTEAQSRDDNFGIEAQKQAILLYADEHGYTIVRWFQDVMSGTSDDRPEWNDLLYNDKITNPPFEAVIAFKSDRIARDTKLYFYYLYVLEKRNIKLLSTQEHFENDDLASLYRSVMLFVAEQERKNITTRTGAGRKVKAATGGYSGGRCPYGYRVSDGKLIINEDERPIVEFIFNEKREMEANGGKVNILKIATDLNDNGYRTRKGTMFLHTNVKSILGNEPLYRGQYRYGKDSIWIKGKHEPILGD